LAPHRGPCPVLVRLARRGRRADQAGHPPHEPRPAARPLPPCPRRPAPGAAGERPKRVILGTSVVTPTFRYHPAIVAQAMATLATLNPGRMILGVGTGESMNEVPLLGIDWPDSPERFARLKEAIELSGRLWGGGFGG